MLPQFSFCLQLVEELKSAETDGLRRVNCFMDLFASQVLHFIQCEIFKICGVLQGIVGQFFVTVLVKHL